MTTRTPRRLPGVSFSVEPHPQVALPRMDVAAFVGLASSGPLHTPVPVEDAAQLRAIFGPAPRLGWDAQAGAEHVAALAGAVQDFFAQGGRRCWVVRVAGEARFNAFPLAGLLAATTGGYGPALARARSPGSWSDGLRAGVSLLVEPVLLADAAVVAGETFAGEVGTLRGEPLRPGDLLQIDGADGLARAYVRVERADDARAAPGRGRQQRVSGEAHWFQAATGEAATPGTVATVPFDGSDPVTWAATLTGLGLDHDPPPGGALPEPGDWLRFTPAGGGAIWLLAEGATPAATRLRAAWREGATGLRLAARTARVTLALVAYDEQQPLGTLEGLGLAAPHARLWAALPDDAARFRDVATGQRLDLGDAVALFPLAGPADPAALYLPLGLDATPVALRGALALDGSPLERDGLVPPGVPPEDLDGPTWAAFLASAHLDPELRLAGAGSLMAEATELRDVEGRRLRGIHSLAHIDEISMLAMPDAAQRGWHLEERAITIEEPPPTPPLSVDPCAPRGPFKPAPMSPPSTEGAPTPPAPLALVSAPERFWALLPEAAYDPAGLLELHLRAADLAAARADMVAVLGLPLHYRSREALAHRQALGQLLDGAATSYVALYHPGLLVRGLDGALQRRGPEGAACGLIAARTLERGAWGAPANMPARGALALVPQLTGDETAALYGAGVNILRPDARGPTLWSAQTLSDDGDLAPLNVRRLLILLRRIVLRDGQEHVFAPNGPSFRRRLALQLERLLSLLFERGAFAGQTRASAFQVVVDERLNPPARADQGRLVVELRVAPARPMEFIVVRLIETGAGSLVAQEV